MNIDETAARIDRLATLRTAGLISEEHYTTRLGELLDQVVSAEPRELR